MNMSWTSNLYNCPISSSGYVHLQSDLHTHVSSIHRYTRLYVHLDSVLAKELKSSAPLLLSIAFSFDVVERMSLKQQLCFDL